MDLKEIGWGGMNWAALAQDRDQCGAPFERGNKTSGSINC
jgi:hypothetical protein